MQSSKLETKIEQILKDADVKFVREYTFPDLLSTSARHLRFDFAVFDDDNNLDYVIEAQGKQHYEPVRKFGGEKGLRRQQFNDDLKRRYCYINKIKLVYVPY